MAVEIQVEEVRRLHVVAELPPGPASASPSVGNKEMLVLYVSAEMVSESPFLFIDGIRQHEPEGGHQDQPHGRTHQESQRIYFPEKKEEGSENREYIDQNDQEANLPPGDEVIPECLDDLPFIIGKFDLHEAKVGGGRAHRLPYDSRNLLIINSYIVI